MGKINHVLVDYVLVAGAAHLDVLASYDESESRFIDKKGNIQYSIGGTAYNIAMFLSDYHVPVYLYTVLKKDSLITEFIIEKLQKNNVSCDYIQLDEHVPESGFVAHMRNGNLISAVSCSGIEQAEINKEMLTRAIANAKFVVMDCNLSDIQIYLISKIASEYRKMIIMSGVSESKVNRAKSVYSDESSYFTIELLSINEKEAEVFFKDYGQNNEPLYICKQAKAKNVVVTERDRGFTVYTVKNETLHFQAPDISRDKIKTTLKAGDALLSGICNYVYNNRKIAWDNNYIIQLIYAYVTKALCLN